MEEQQQEFKLIHAVDPTKVNLPIRDKFAKLTLSSNTKKNEQKDEDHNVPQVERRQSASRNLLLQLNNDAENLISSKAEKVQIYINPILRSDSDSMGTYGTQVNEETQITASEEQKHIEEVESLTEMERSELMAPLHMSTEDFTQQQDINLYQQVDILSEKVSSLALNVRSISDSENSHEVTQLLSKESLRMSSGIRLPQVGKIECKKEFTTVSQNSAISICISLSSDDEEAHHQTDEEDETSSVITVSDSTLSNAGGVDGAVDCELITSNIPHSGETGEEYLPSTFSNDKADRMEAFLHDVSLERRQLELQGNVQAAEKYVKENSKTNQVHKELPNTKAQLLAAADTESMSPYEKDEERKIDVKKLDNASEHILTLDDTAPMSQSQFSMFAFESERKRSNVVGSPSQQHEINKDFNDSKRLADDDTEVNTHLYDNSDEFCSFIDHSLSINNSTHNPSRDPVIPEESVVISETSSEADSYTQKPSEILILSEQTATAVLPNDDLESQLSQIQMSMGSINISAKINIKIQISHQSASDESSIISGENDPDENIGDEPNAENITTSFPEKEESTEVDTKLQQKQQKQHADDQIEQSDSTIVEGLIGDKKLDEVEFMTYAEKLLNECYGQSWRTPINVRKLKRIGSANSPTSSTKKNSSSTKKNATLSTKGSGVHKNKNKTANKNIEADVVEESVLDDFSIFRRNIVKTNLDSTRLGTLKHQKREVVKKNFPITATNSEPRGVKPSSMESNVFKVLQSEIKKRTVTTSRGRIVKGRWRNLVDDDNDSQGANASDDDHVNCTENNDESSDKSWGKNRSEDDSTDSDYEMGATRKATSRSRRCVSNSKDKLIYLDLSKDEVSILEGAPESPPANNDENFNTRLQDILRTCKHEDKLKLVATPITPGTKSKRKLFTLNFGDEEELGGTNAPLPDPPKNVRELIEEEGLLENLENIYPSGKIPPKFDIFNKQLEAIKTGKPIFKLTPPRNIGTPVKSTPRSKVAPVANKNTRSKETSSTLDKLCATPDYKYGFLKSLDVCVGKSLCHPDALMYRENYRTKKEELTGILFDLYKAKLFGSDFNVPLIWNKKLCNTAGRCLNKNKMGIRSSVIELSEKVLTSADRLRCTLIHELCHAATWIYSGEGGHGTMWKNWARKANSVFPEIPTIGVCHQYDIEYKYTYKCTLCNAKSHAHSKSKKVENIRCSYCHGAIEIYLNKKDKDGNIMPTPVKEPTGFAKFVKDNYKQYKRPDLKHADVMKILSNEFSALKLASATANQN